MSPIKSTETTRRDSAPPNKAPKRKELERAVESKLRAALDTTREAFEGLRAGTVDFEDFDD